MARSSPGEIPASQVRELSGPSSAEGYSTILDKNTLLSTSHQMAEFYGLKGAHNGDADAFRHAFSSAMVSCQYGRTASFALGVGYEVHNFIDWSMAVASGDIDNVIDSYKSLVKESSMDIWNDAQGVRPSICEGGTRLEQARAIRDLLDSGTLMILKNGDLNRSGPERLERDIRQERVDIQGPVSRQRDQDSLRQDELRSPKRSDELIDQLQQREDRLSRYPGSMMG